MKRLGLALLTILLLLSGAKAQNVVLTWVQSTSPNVTANNVYRAPVSSGPWNPVHNSASPIVTWTDTNVVLGQTYCWVVTALANGYESPHSNYRCKTITTMAPTKLTLQ